MANISLLSRLVNGVQRQVDLSTNTLVVQAIQINGTLLSSAVGAGNEGSELVGDFDSYSHFTPTAATVKGALSGIDTALGTVTSASANQQLSNLSGTVAVNLSLTPGADNSINLGSASFSWASANIHTLKDGSSVISVDAYNRLLVDAAGLTSVDYANRALKDSSGATQLSWSTSGVELNSGALNMNSHQINNLAMAATPAQTDATNVNYVMSLLQGLSPKGSVKAATTTALPANTYNNGTAGVGATLTAASPGVLVVDGYTVQLNDRILVKNEAAALGNGIYYVSTLGTVSVPYVLTRTTDADTCQPASNPSVTSGIWCFVETTSTTLGNQGWMLATPDPITLGTTALNWSQFYAQGEYIFGNGLTVSGVNVSVNLSASGALSFTGSAIQVNTSTTGGIQISSNQLALLLVSSTALVTSASGLAWQFDNSTIGVNGSNQAFVKNAGISATQLATGAFDQVTITGGAGTAASVAQSPVVAWTETAGQTFAANTTYAVRYGLPSNSETAGRVYAADITTTSFDLFWVIGFIQTGGSSVTAGTSVNVIQSGSLTLKSADTNFGANDPGKAIFLQSGGTNASTTAPSTSGQAVAKLGIVQSTTSFRAQISAPYVY